MKQKVLLISLLSVLLSIPGVICAQQSNDEPSRWFFGGYFGAQFGHVTLIDISPIVGYMLTERLALGVGATYKYYRIRNFFDPVNNTVKPFRTHIYGGNTFSRFFINRNFFAHGEYEYLRYSNELYGNANFHSVFLGGGYRQYFGSSSAAEIMILWNLNETPNSPYTNPVIRIGFAIGR